MGWRDSFKDYMQADYITSGEMDDSRREVDYKTTFYLECPKCGEEANTVFQAPYFIDNLRLLEECRCLACGMVWVNTYIVQYANSIVRQE